MIGLASIIDRGGGYPEGNHQVPLEGGSGTGALAKVVIDRGAVRSFEIVDPGRDYRRGDALSVTEIGGVGSGFGVIVNELAVAFCPTQE